MAMGSVGAAAFLGCGSGGTQGRSPRSHRSVMIRTPPGSSQIAVLPYRHTVKRSTSLGHGLGHKPRAGSAETINDT